MKLFSYCIPIDDGAAPNPFFGECTLVICKPVIRRVAQVGDWVCGIGASNVNGKDYSGKLIYAMKITSKMLLEMYDDHCRAIGLPKIPNLSSDEYRRKVGDCIYDYSDPTNIKLRPSVHSDANRETDLGGQYALISRHYFYFGENAVNLPHSLRGIIKQGPGHQSVLNEHAKEEFVKWIEENFDHNKLYGEPQAKIDFASKHERDECARIRCESAKKDETLPYDEEKLPLSHWNYFLALEADLKTISRYIELHKSNFQTFSVALTQLFLASCSEVDVVLKAMSILLSGAQARNIREYMEVVTQKSPGMIDKEVSIPIYGISLKPWSRLVAESNSSMVVSLQ